MSEISLSQFIADRIRKAGAAFHAACEKMPEDRIAWHPTTEGNSGRDALDQLLECAYLNEWAAGAYRNQAVPPFDANDYKQRMDANRNKAAALRWFKEATNALADAIAAFPVSRLGDAITDPLHNTPTTWADFAIDLFYWNTVYHEGQVNYIQVLYGDLS